MKKSTGLIIGIILLGIIALVDWRSTKISSSPQLVQVPSTVSETIPEKQSPLTLEQVALHNTKTSCYTIIAGKVYNLTDWIAAHPGGSQAILRLCGTDGTTAFERQHGSSKKAASTLQEFLLGELE